MYLCTSVLVVIDGPLQGKARHLCTGVRFDHPGSGASISGTMNNRVLYFIWQSQRCRQTCDTCEF